MPRIVPVNTPVPEPYAGSIFHFNLTCVPIESIEVSTDERTDLSTLLFGERLFNDDVGAFFLIFLRAGCDEICEPRAAKLNGLDFCAGPEVEFLCFWSPAF